MRCLCLVALCASLSALGQETLPGSQPLAPQEDFSARMVAGIDRFLTRETERSVSARQRFWHRDFSSGSAYERSVATNRARLRRLIGAVDRPVPSPGFEVLNATNAEPSVAETDGYTVRAVRWPVLEGVSGEGLLVQPRKKAAAWVVAIPDADQAPEMLVGLVPGLAPERQFARRLAENGCAVVVPVLIDRQDTWSGNASIERFTNQPHREWIYRQAFELGRHVIGYEVQKVLAAIDCIQQERATTDPVDAGAAPAQAIGVAGYAEGGLIALYSAALDTRIRAALVSGYFDSRQHLYREPIYRNVFGLLREFGDAELASLVAPRHLLVEHSPTPQIDGPPAGGQGRRTSAAPGGISTLDYESVETEFERARQLLKPGSPKEFNCLALLSGAEGMMTGPGSDRALAALLNALGHPVKKLKPAGSVPTDLRADFSAADRQHRQLKELEEYTQELLVEAERVRADFFWNQVRANAPQGWETARAAFRSHFWEEVIGRLPSPTMPANPRTRRYEPKPSSSQTTNGAPSSSAHTWTGYEVTLDVFPEVFAWGYLLVPGDLKAGGRRPVVVCQHGLEGLPSAVLNPDPGSQDFKYYRAFAARLAEEGYIVFAPHNPYRGQTRFRQLQRKANPLKLSLFSVIVAQHERILDWLSGLPFVDAKRIGFYGLSYGGTTAMRVPAVLDGYALSICSGNFTDWLRKSVCIDSPASYMYHGEYEMYEFNLGHTFNHAEMAALIAPRPFMVERGHRDPVSPDEWVGREYAKVKEFYERLGIPERTSIEFFDGGHLVNGAGTFEFLHQHLGHPKARE